jgi:hypothetical protein
LAGAGGDEFLPAIPEFYFARRYRAHDCGYSPNNAHDFHEKPVRQHAQAAGRLKYFMTLFQLFLVRNSSAPFWVARVAGSAGALR